MDLIDLTINWNGGAAQLYVATLDGRTVLELSITGPTEKIDTSHFAPGAYAVSISSERGIVGAVVVR
ncbi:MAG TPA: hypothetical protein VK147_06305 [Candidatus Didemnitutus sp.]|nr:hypothetical protein [Candidatus Didemnitutus sp.]